VRKKNPAAAARSGRSSGATALRPMSRSRFGGSGPTLSERDEYLAQQVAGKGVHPIDVARRIISRMPDAWSAVPAQVRDLVPVTTGYNTHWEYRIDKRPDGYVASLTPQDVEARRRTGGKTGGFLGPSGLSGRAFVYRTKGEAYEAIAKHAAKGQYLLQKNPTDFALAYEGRLRDLTRASDGLIRVQMNPDQQYTVVYSGVDDYDSSFDGTMVKPWATLEQTFLDAESDSGIASNAKITVIIGGLKRVLKGDNAGATRLIKSALDAGQNVEVVFYGYDAYNHYRISPSLRNPSRRGASMNAGLKRGQSLMAKAAAAYRAGKYPNMAAALKGVSGNGGRRSNPTDWALAYEGRLRDLTGESDGLIRVEMNGKRNRRGGSAAQAAGLKRGQSLMKRAAAAYRSGKYPTMQAALKGESRKG